MLVGETSIGIETGLRVTGVGIGSRVKSGDGLAPVAGDAVAVAMGVSVSVVKAGTSVIGDNVGNNEVGSTVKGIAVGRAIGIILDGTVGCIAIGVDLNGGFEIGAESDGTIVATGTSGRIIGVGPVGGINIGVTVLGDIDCIGAGSGVTMFIVGGVVGNFVLETGDVGSSEISMRLTTLPELSTVTLESKPQSLSSLSILAC